MATNRPTAPAVPDPNDPDSFEARVYPYLLWQAQDQAAANQQAQDIELLAIQAANGAASAQAAGINGISSSSTSNTVGSGAKTWTVAETGKTYAPGISVTIARTAAASTIFMRGIVTAWNSSTRVLGVDVGANTGSGTFTDWTISTTTAGPAGAVSETYEARVANGQLTAADSGKFIDITAGSFTQTFAPFGALGGAWRCRIRNSGTGDIQVTSDGATYFMYPGEVRDFNCDGTALRSVPIKSFTKTLTGSGNFVPPPGYQQALADLLGGGAGGHRTTTTQQNGGGGGGGGGRTTVVVPLTNPGVAMPVIVGTGGTGATASNTAGTAGGNTTFGGLTAYGGGIPSIGTSYTLGSSGGPGASGLYMAVSTGAYVVALGSAGGGAYNGGNSAAINSEYGGASGSSSSGAAPSPIGGASAFGGGGGGGGGLSNNSQQGFNGGQGGGNAGFGSGGGLGGVGNSTTGANTSVVNGTAGAAGGYRQGGGGGGGGNGNGGNGGAGGNGGVGGGGGGGGAAYAGTPGNGGNGGRGEVTITGMI